MSQVEVLSVTDTGRRRRWTEAEKLRIVQESYAAPSGAAATARRYDIARSLLTRWRREAREGLLAAEGGGRQFTPVAVVPAPAAGSIGADVRNVDGGTVDDRIEIILLNGRRLATPSTVEASFLARLIQIVERA